MPTVKRKSRPPATPREVPELLVLPRWGPNLFAPFREDPLDGTRLGRFSFRRGPDGGLLGFEDKPETPDDHR